MFDSLSFGILCLAVFILTLYVMKLDKEVRRLKNSIQNISKLNSELRDIVSNSLSLSKKINTDTAKAYKISAELCNYVDILIKHINGESTS